jgi:argininosuccinate lyase
LCGDLILFSTEEYSFVSLPDGICTGSSLMPHKKNPDALELVRGKASQAIGALFTLFSLTEGLPSTYNRDLQEDKGPLFRSMGIVEDSLSIVTLAVEGLVIDRERMEEAVMTSNMSAVEMAEYLALKGVPCEEQKKYLWEMGLDEMRAFSDAFDSTVFDYINPRSVVNSRKTPGGASISEVEKQIETEKAYLSR